MESSDSESEVESVTVAVERPVKDWSEEVKDASFMPAADVPCGDKAFYDKDVVTCVLGSTRTRGGHQFLIVARKYDGRWSAFVEKMTLHVDYIGVCEDVPPPTADHVKGVYVGDALVAIEDLPRLLIFKDGEFQLDEGRKLVFDLSKQRGDDRLAGRVSYHEGERMLVEYETDSVCKIVVIDEGSYKVLGTHDYGVTELCDGEKLMFIREFQREGRAPFYRTVVLQRSGDRLHQSNGRMNGWAPAERRYGRLRGVGPVVYAVNGLMRFKVEESDVKYGGDYYGPKVLADIYTTYSKDRGFALPEGKHSRDEKYVTYEKDGVTLGFGYFITGSSTRA